MRTTSINKTQGNSESPILVQTDDKDDEVNADDSHENEEEEDEDKTPLN